MSKKEGQWIKCSVKDCKNQLYIQANFSGYVRCGKCGKVHKIKDKDIES